MGRSIVVASPAPERVATRGVPDGDAPSQGAPSDPYGDRLMKLIPGEVIGLYLSMTAILSSSNDANSAAAPWVLLILGAAATLLYLRIGQKVGDKVQLLTSVAAFCVWAIAIGGPFAEQSWYSGTYAGMALASFTFIAPLIPMGQGNTG